MNRLAQVLLQAGEHLTRLGYGWAVVGGLAVSARAEPRLTRDVDLAVAVANDRDAEKLVRQLQEFGYRLYVSLEQKETQRLATVRLVPPGSEEPTAVVDLLFASSGIESSIVAEATELELFPGMRVRVAAVGHLIALKLLARDDRRRPQDFDDLQALLREAGEGDVEQARRALRQIEEAGFNRGRSLLGDLETLWQDISADDG